VGNVLMGDDGIGPAAIEALRQRGAEGCAELIDAGLAFSDVLCTLSPDKPLIVIDAIRGPDAPGGVYRLGPDDLEEAALAAATSLHEVSVLPALRMEALAGRTFENVTMFGIEPADVDWREGLSECVAAAMDELIDTILEHCGMNVLKGIRT
jgi:hydrogenase maturation protease